MSGALCPILGFPLRRHCRTAASAVGGYPGDTGLEQHMVYKEMLGIASFSPKKKRLLLLSQPPHGQVQRSQNWTLRRDGCGRNERQQAQVAAWEMLLRPKEILFHQEGDQALEQVAQVGCEIPVLADTQNSTEQTHTGSALSERLAQTCPRGPCQLKLLYDSVNRVELKVLCFPAFLF